MKRLITFACLLPFAFAPMTAHAEVFYDLKVSPNTVKMASHIFVGEAEEFKVVNTAGQEVKPVPKMLNPKQAVEVTVRVSEVLSPTQWKPNGKIKVRISGGFYTVQHIRWGLAGKKLIYLTRITSLNSGNPVFKTLYGKNIAENLRHKTEIRTIVKNQQR